jgi:hypothetical protein
MLKQKNVELLQEEVSYTKTQHYAKECNAFLHWLLISGQASSQSNRDIPDSKKSVVFDMTYNVR